MSMPPEVRKPAVTIKNDWLAWFTRTTSDPKKTDDSQTSPILLPDVGILSKRIFGT